LGGRGIAEFLEGLAEVEGHLAHLPGVKAMDLPGVKVLFANGLSLNSAASMSLTSGRALSQARMWSARWPL
jgi:hypothetical protein